MAKRKALSSSVEKEKYMRKRKNHERWAQCKNKRKREEVGDKWDRLKKRVKLEPWMINELSWFKDFVIQKNQFFLIAQPHYKPWKSPFDGICMWGFWLFDMNGNFISCDLWMIESWSVTLNTWVIEWNTCLVRIAKFHDCIFA